MNTQTSYFKKALVVLMAVMMVFTMMPGMAWAEEPATSGVDGNIAWSLDSEGTLTISKKADATDGTMNNYQYSLKVPWTKASKKNKIPIKAVIIEDGVTSIGEFAFSGATQMQSINIPESVTSIGKKAFEKSALTEITLPCSPATTALTNLSALKKVAFYDSVTVIEDSAVSNCHNLKEVSLPASLQEISPTAFNGCESIEKMTLVAGNPKYEIRSGLLLEKNENSISLVMNAGAAGLVEIPNGIDTIPQNIFCKSTLVKEVRLPQSIRTIENRAFFDCSELTKINLPEGLVSIGDYTFSGCSKLNILSFPTTLQSIGESAFKDNGYLEEAILSSTTTTIGTQAFYGCTGLKTIATAGVNTSLFEGCTALEEATILDGVTALADNMFANCPSLKRLYIPASLVSLGKNNVTPICGEGVKNFNTEKGILYNEDKTEILYADKEMHGEVSIPDGVKKINAAAFQDCKDITVIQLPDSLTEIGTNAFANCSQLQEIRFGTKVVSIGESAFQKCIKLQKVEMPDSVTSVGKFLFSGCSSLSEVKLSAALTAISYGMFFKTGLVNFTVPETIHTIQGYAFSSCKNLKAIDLPETVTSIQTYAFTGTALESVRIPQAAAEIAEGTFSACTSLREITIPVSVKQIGNNAFSGTETTLCVVNFAGGLAEWDAISGDKPTLAKWTNLKINYYYEQEGNPEDAPKIIKLCENQTFKKGDNATNKLSVTIAKPTEGETITAQWYSNIENTTSGGSAIQTVLNEDSTIATATPNTDKAGNTYYYCIITKKDANGKFTQTRSAIVVVSVTVAGFTSGSGSETDPYLIDTVDELQTLQRLVNQEAESMEGIFFKLTSNITLPEDWVPIGCTKNGSNNIEEGANLNPFSGTIDGGDNTITVAKGGKPLIGYVKNATVRNLKIYGEEINGYGLVDNFEGVGLSGNAITIDHVTITTGTRILKSGLLGANKTTNGFAGVSAGFTANIRNCTIEKDVVIGYDKSESQIGGFAGRMQGTIENCVNHGTVYGKDFVGGIIGTRDNAMGDCIVKTCKTYGDVIGSGTNVGGIVGGGYENGSAPNGIKVEVLACTASGSVSGDTNIGGILGGDQYVAQAWNAYSFIGNVFTGKISGKTNVGAIIGFYDSLNKMDNISANYFKKDCGAADGIGMVKYVDTNCKDIEKTDGVVHLNTESSVKDCPDIYGCGWRKGFNRTDDPLGADKDNLTKAVSSVPDKICYELIVSGEYPTTYYMGDELDFSKAIFTAKWNDGTETHPRYGNGKDDVKVSGYNSFSHSVQTITLSYGYAKTELQIAVLKKESGDVKKNTLNVNFQLLGDKKHDSDSDKNVHTLSHNNLTSWTSGKYEVGLNATVWNLMQKVQSDNRNITFKARGSQYGTYVYAVTYNNTTLGELDNGKLSGWMYTVNGTHPEVGVGSKFLNDGDTVVFHYTDDYTKEEGSDKWGVPGADEVKDVTTSGAAGSASTTAPTEVKVSGTTATATIKAENQSEILKQAAEKKSAEIILEVSAANTKGADSVQLSLEVSFVKNISDKTDADLTVNTENGKVTLDRETIKTVLAEAKGATITLEVSKVSKPTEVQKKAAGANGHLLKLTIKSGDRVISDFNKGKVKVVAEIVSKLLDKKVAAIHIAADGKIEQLAGKVLTIGGKKYYEFMTPHFSTFALVDADELGLDVAEEPQTDVKALTAKLTPVARSAKTAKKNVKVTT